MIVEWMQATAGQNLARRLISLAVTAVWLGQYVLGQVLAIISIFMSDSKPFAASAEVLRARAEDMNGAVMLILAFYFTAPHVGDFARAIIERKSKQQ